MAGQKPPPLSGIKVPSFKKKQKTKKPPINKPIKNHPGAESAPALIFKPAKRELL